MPLPPAYKVTAQSVANKGEPFVSGINNSAAAVQAFVDGISHQVTAAASGRKRLEVSKFLSPKAMLAEQLPHLKWSDAVPPILSFYSFAALLVV